MEIKRSPIWVTGGTRGLGKAVAERLALTHELILSYRAADDHAQRLHDELATSTGRPPLMLRGDLSLDGVAQFQVSDILQKFGHLGGVVHCAAVGAFKPLLTMRPRELRRILAYSFEAFHQVVLAAAGPLSSSRGAIVAVSSMGARRTLEGYGGMGAAKAALESYSRHLATELGSRGIRVNVVSPGLLMTASLSRLGIDQESLSLVEGRTPLSRLTTKDEVAEAIAFLLSDAASGITGQTLIVDGGYEIRG